ncbi:MAG: peptidoglycan-binding domain-containing protein [Eubacteriales bacterium]|nr:peptidoglycan-binding domain-containing protein [Eubacteriales bacterium]
MKKQFAAIMLAATLLPCNVYASEEFDHSYQIGLLSYELSSDWIETENTTEIYKESRTFQNGSSLLEVSAFEINADSNFVLEGNQDDSIHNFLQIPAHYFSEFDEYIEISGESFYSSLNTPAYLSSCEYELENDNIVSIIYSMYYENNIYNAIITSLDLDADYTSTIVDFDNSLKPAEILSNTAAVQKVQETLNQKGYDAGFADGIFGPSTEAAIKNYQKDHVLLETGKITNKLLEDLEIQLEAVEDYTAVGLPNSEFPAEIETQSPVETPVESPIGTTVWIPNTGSKYHSNAYCSNMKNPSQVTLEDAQAMGYTPCKKCY